MNEPTMETLARRLDRGGTVHCLSRWWRGNCAHRGERLRGRRFNTQVRCHILPRKGRGRNEAR